MSDTIPVGAVKGTGEARSGGPLTGGMDRFLVKDPK
jgi:hypothetical protein